MGEFLRLGQFYRLLQKPGADSHPSEIFCNAHKPNQAKFLSRVEWSVPENQRSPTAHREAETAKAHRG